MKGQNVDKPTAYIRSDDNAEMVQIDNHCYMARPGTGVKHLDDLPKPVKAEALKIARAKLGKAKLSKAERKAAVTALASHPSVLTLARKRIAEMANMELSS